MNYFEDFLIYETRQSTAVLTTITLIKQISNTDNISI